MQADHSDEINEVRAEIARMNQQLQPFNEQLAALREGINPMWQAIAEKLREHQPELDKIDCPDFAADEDDDPLFDSTRV